MKLLLSLFFFGFVLSLNAQAATTYSCYVEGHYKDFTGHITRLPAGETIIIRKNEIPKYFGEKCQKNCTRKQWGLQIQERECNTRNEPCEDGERILKLSVIAPNGNASEDAVANVYTDPLARKISLQSWGHNLFVFCNAR